MPSFIIHSACVQKLNNHLKLEGIDYKKLFIGNLLPDSKISVVDTNLSEKEIRSIVQHDKIKTHFRTDFNSVLSYPDINLFISKYKEECSSNYVSLGYLLHLYTDFKFFTEFMNKEIVFLDEFNNVTNIKNCRKYVLVKKTNKKLLEDDFFSKTDYNGIYREYDRLNNYVFNKYNLNIDNNLYDIDISNNIINISNSSDSSVIKRLYSFLDNHDDDTNLLIFNESDIDYFIDKTVKNFINEFNYIIEKIRRNYD